MPPPIQPPLPSIVGSYRATDVVGSPPTVLVDRSGNGFDLAGSGALIVVRDGTPRLSAAGAANYVAPSAAPWKPLNDGTGGSVLMVLRPTIRGPEDAILDTGVRSSLTNGFGLWQDTVKRRLYLSICNGAGVVITEATWLDSWQPDADHVLVVTFTMATLPHFHIWIDGKLVHQFSLGQNDRDGVGLPLNMGSPSFPLNLFSFDGGPNGMAGEIAEAIVTSSVVPDLERVAYENYASDRYPGVVLNRVLDGQVIFDGNSLLVLNSGEPRPISPEGVPPLLIRPTLPEKTAVFGLRTAEMVARAPVHVYPLFNAARPFNIVVGWEFINSLAVGVPKETVYAQYIAYAQAMRMQGFKFGAITICPCAGVAEADEEWVNQQLFANWPSFADFLITPSLDPIIGSWAVWAADTGNVYRSDGTHWTDQGSLLVRPWFVDGINAFLELLSRPPSPPSHCCLRRSVRR